MAYELLPFILETNWDKPELLRVRQMKQGRKKLDVIETIVEGKQLDFIYEPEEMLVREVKEDWGHKRGLGSDMQFSGYADV